MYRIKQLEKVSIPYRLATNKQEYLLYSLLHRVSIPYRLATNQSNTASTKQELEFQFLIGWLQTCFKLSLKEVYIVVSIPYRLATNTSNIILYQIQNFVFQFLIGWLQTMKKALQS